MRVHSCLSCSGNLAYNFGRFWCKNRPFYYCKHAKYWFSEDPHCSLLIHSSKWAHMKYKRLGYISLSPIVVFVSNLACHEWKMAKNCFVPSFGQLMWQKLQKYIKLNPMNRKYLFQYDFPRGLMARVAGFHPAGPGSIPGWGETSFSSYFHV